MNRPKIEVDSKTIQIQREEDEPVVIAPPVPIRDHDLKTAQVAQSSRKMESPRAVKDIVGAIKSKDTIIKPEPKVIKSSPVRVRDLKKIRHVAPQHAQEKSSIKPKRPNQPDSQRMKKHEIRTKNFEIISPISHAPEVVYDDSLHINQASKYMSSEAANANDPAPMVLREQDATTVADSSGLELYDIGQENKNTQRIIAFREFELSSTQEVTPESQTFIEHIKAFVESKDFEDPVLAVEVPVLLESIESIVQQIEAIQFDELDNEQALKTLVQKLEVVSYRFLECLGEDVSDEAVNQFIKLLFSDKQYIVADALGDPELIDEGTHERKQFSLEGIGYFAQGARASFTALGRCAMAAI